MSENNKWLGASAAALLTVAPIAPQIKKPKEVSMWKNQNLTTLPGCYMAIQLCLLE